MKKFGSLCSVWLAEWVWIDHHADWSEWTVAFSPSLSHNTADLQITVVTRIQTLWILCKTVQEFRCLQWFGGPIAAWFKLVIQPILNLVFQPVQAEKCPKLLHNQSTDQAGRPTETIKASYNTIVFDSKNVRNNITSLKMLKLKIIFT